jgi:hypothetical protein
MKRLTKNVPTRKKKKLEMIIPPKWPILIKPNLTPQRSRSYWTNFNKVESLKNNTTYFNLGT